MQVAEGGSELPKAQATTVTSTSITNVKEPIRTVRWLRFSNALHVTLIPSRREYIDTGILFDIYFSEDELTAMKRSAIDEIRTYMIEHNVTRREATTALFQPDQEKRQNCTKELYHNTEVQLDGARTMPLFSQMLNFITDDCLFDKVVETSFEQRKQGVYLGEPRMTDISVAREFMLLTDAYDDMQLLSFRRGYITSEV